MTFREFVYRESEIADDVLAQVKAFAERRRLGVPTTLLDSGMQGGVVYNTTDPNMVVRIGPSDNDSEQSMADEDLQDTGGVVKVYAIREFQGYLASWKERVDENVEGYIYRSFTKEQQQELFSVLSGLYHVTREGIKILKKYPATKGLADAIMGGLSVSDLDISQNLGVTKDRRIVAFDA